MQFRKTKHHNKQKIYVIITTCFQFPCLLNDAFATAQPNKIFHNDNDQRVRAGAAVAYFMAQSQSSPEGAEKTH